jgi:predicted nucleotidyltransferase
MLLPVNSGRVPWLNPRTILLTKHGSQAYGTSTPESDLDVKGVAVAPRECYLGFLQRFEQAEFAKYMAEVDGKRTEVDATVYDLQKFFKLAMACNPNIIEVLWVRPGDLLKVTPAGERLLEARRDFLSKKAKHTFSGYARSQLGRIDTHRRWLLDPPKAPPERKEFGLPEMAKFSKQRLGAVEVRVKEKLDSWGFDWDRLEDRAMRLEVRAEFEQTLTEMGLGNDEQWESAARLVGMEENFIDLIQRERHYRDAKANWSQYQNWKKNRNPARAELEARFGFDAKHAMHLVRLMRMAREILETGTVHVYRPDAEELLAIRNGAWSYEKLTEWADEQEKALNELYKSSLALPMAPNRVKLDELCIELLEPFLAVHVPRWGQKGKDDVR